MSAPHTEHFIGYAITTESSQFKPLSSSIENSAEHRAHHHQYNQSR